ncbi:MAG: hypothetical protein ACKVT0_01400 [Planctomycetaceae bacterium]
MVLWQLNGNWLELLSRRGPTCSYVSVRFVSVSLNMRRIVDSDCNDVSVFSDIFLFNVNGAETISFHLMEMILLYAHHEMTICMAVANRVANKLVERTGTGIGSLPVLVGSLTMAFLDPKGGQHEGPFSKSFVTQSCRGGRHD